jgi:multiple sugar transport system ATP-binding protein
MSHLSIEHLVKQYGTTVAVNGLNIDIEQGECVALLGPSGAGKTTTLRCIVGLEKPEQGRILIHGNDIAAMSPAQRDVALVFQQYSLYPTLTVYQNLEFPLVAPGRRIDPAERQARIRRTAELLSIAHLLDRRTDRLSGGEMQRVSIGRAMVRNPSILLLDEPLSNLDAKLREVLRSEIRQLRQRLGSTMLLVTHDQVEALSIGDRVGVMQEGRLLQMDSPDQIYLTPRNTFVAAFVGAPAMNLLPARMGDQRMVTEGLHWPIPLHLPAQLGRDSRFTLGVRPEDLSIEAVTESQALHEPGAHCRIWSVEQLGAETLLTLELNQQPLLRARMASSAFGNGQWVRVSAAPQAFHFFHPDSGERLTTS